MREYLRKQAVRIGLGLLLLLALFGHTARIYQVPFVNQLDAIIYDYRMRLTMPQTVDERIVILDIDERSLMQEGRWPWSRDRLAQLVDRLFGRHQAAVLGFDVVFAERDESSGIRVLEELSRSQLKDLPRFRSAVSELAPSLDYDRRFAESMRARRVILGYYFSREEGRSVQVSGQLPAPVLPAGTFAGRPIDFTVWDGYGANLPELQRAAAGAGHFNPLPDAQDGVIRRVPMLAKYRGAYYEALSLAVVRAYLGFPPVIPVIEGASRDYSGLEWLALPAGKGMLRIPVDHNVCTLVPYRGRQGSFRYVSAGDVLADRLEPGAFKDKIVLMGATAPGLLDLRSTPVQGIYPGVEIHANLISGILDQDLKTKPPYVLGIEVVILMASGLLLVFLMPLLTPFMSALLVLGVLGSVAGGNLALWQFGHLVVPLASPLLLIAGLFALNMSWGYFVEARGKRQITGLFGRYVSPALVNEMARNPEGLSMEGDSREMSVLFSDVRGFTRISEGMDPKELTRFMNEFLTRLTEVIYRNRGTVDKYMGDCVMAFWGAPLADPDHARHAVRAGLEMQAALLALQPRFRDRGWPEIKAGVGINSGVMRVGNMGSQMRVAYTVMGDAVNLASRLEGVTRQYGVDMVVGENTRRALPDFVFRELDRVRVMGKDEPVAIHEPVGENGKVDGRTLEEVALFHQALRHYRAQDWDQAELELYNLRKMSPGTELYRVYEERVAYLRAHPPGAGWDGVWVFETK
ncbi:MAG TPA: adenylate/guanylate cyclase domain-containing protein [Burkholderiales bacterium]|nr:adenylate/guanylate cyclase domain-containing protein [Burkholderiales bacterium]